jgi:hypothetical protein
MANATRVASLIVVLLLTCSAGQAQHRWNGKEKHWYTDWLWWVGEGVIVTAFVLDAHSTALVRERCPGCPETNPFIGPHPSNRAIITASSIFFGIETGLHIGSWKACPDPNREFKSWYVACDTTVPAIVAAWRIPAAVHNYHIASIYRPTQSLSTTRFAQALSIGGPTPATTSWPVGRYNDKPIFLSKQISGCGQSLPLCTLFQPAAGSKRDLRSVRFR